MCFDVLYLDMYIIYESSAGCWLAELTLWKFSPSLLLLLTTIPSILYQTTLLQTPSSFLPKPMFDPSKRSFIGKCFSMYYFIILNIKLSTLLTFGQLVLSSSTLILESRSIPLSICAAFDHWCSDSYISASFSRNTMTWMKHKSVYTNLFQVFSHQKRRLNSVSSFSRNTITWMKRKSFYTNMF